MDPAKSILKKLDREFFDENEYHIFSEITCAMTPQEEALAEQISEEIEQDIADEAVAEDDDPDADETAHE